MKLKTILVLSSALFVFCSLPGCSGKSDKTISKDKVDVVVGTMGVNALEEIEAYQPFVDYLNGVERLQKYNFRIVAFTNLEQMKSSLQRGETDIYIDSPYPIATIMEDTDLEIVMNRMKGGVSEYQSVIFAHKDSPIESIADLVGKVIAFEDPASTSSFYLPKISLQRAGFSVIEYNGVNEMSSENISYQFSNDDSNTALWVFIKKVDAGATNDIAYRKFPPKYRENFKIIHRTRKVPRHLLTWRESLDAELKTVLKQILLTMHTTTAGEEALLQFENTLKFETLDSTTELLNFFKESTTSEE